MFNFSIRFSAIPLCLVVLVVSVQITIFMSNKSFLNWDFTALCKKCMKPIIWFHFPLLVHCTILIYFISIHVIN